MGSSYLPLSDATAVMLLTVICNVLSSWYCGHCLNAKCKLVVLLLIHLFIYLLLLLLLPLWIWLACLLGMASKDSIEGGGLGSYMFLPVSFYNRVVSNNICYNSGDADLLGVTVTLVGSADTPLELDRTAQTPHIIIE
jgi:hypothetical protein